MLWNQSSENVLNQKKKLSLDLGVYEFPALAVRCMLRVWYQAASLDEAVHSNAAKIEIAPNSLE